MLPRRIHLLGTGSIGRLVAHSLRDLPNPPPVTLIFHSWKHYLNWEKSKQEITVTTEGISVARGGFDFELARAMFRAHGTSVTKEEFNDPHFWNSSIKPHERMAMRADEEGHETDERSAEVEGRQPIDNLIVSVKAPNTVGALMRVRHRLGPKSSILFLQNGMGIVDEVNKEVFPDPANRPSYLVGIISHGVHSRSNFEAVHAGFGTISIGVPPRSTVPSDGAEASSEPADMTSPTSRYLLRTVCQAPVLAAVGTSPTELFQAQLEKLAVNSVINPITSLMDARNGALNHNFALTRAMRLLLAEISLVIRALPEIKHLPNVGTRFAPDRLETLVVSVAHKTRNNISSMLGDVRLGTQTEIDYINGYIVRRGEELGITCYMNYLICQLVRGKQQLINLESQDMVPIAGTSRRVDP